MTKNVLLVEDDSVSRETLARLLRNVGHSVCAVWSSEDAKAALASFTPDVALMDVRLPGTPGDAFAVYLSHKSPRTKIIFISGDFQLDEPERFGAQVDFLPKPIDVSRLLASIQD